jgi:hypothetical protein
LIQRIKDAVGPTDIATLYRDGLLSGLDPAFVNGLRLAKLPAIQIDLDIDACNVTLADGSVPLERWLENASRLRSHLQDGAVFRGLLDQVRIALAPVGDSARRRGARERTDLPAYDQLPEPTIDHGPVPLDSRFYIERSADLKVRAAIAAGKGQTIVIKGGRQSGKSSLMARCRDLARERGYATSLIDFQGDLDEGHLASLRSLLWHMGQLMRVELGSTARLEDVWTQDLGPKRSLTQFLTAASKAIPSPIVVLLDEVDRVFGLPYQDDFFGWLRTWHTMRVRGDPWNRLTLVLSHATDPSAWLQDVMQSPFNVVDVGAVMSDFDTDHLRQLDRLCGTNLGDTQLGELHRLTGGHPYLTRLSLYTLRTGSCEVEDLRQAVAAHNGPFAPHLKPQVRMLEQRPELAKAVRQVLAQGRCESDRAFRDLIDAGILAGASRDQARIRCDAYAIYLGAHL